MRPTSIRWIGRCGTAWRRKTGATLDWRHIGTPLEECIARDARRVVSIGEHAIAAQAERYRATLEAFAA